MADQRSDRERLEAIQVSTIATEDAVIIHKEEFRWLCERALPRVSAVPVSEPDDDDADEAVEPEVPPEEPGAVAPCCDLNAAHQVFRLIPIPGMEHIRGEGTLSVKSLTTGEYVPVYCCAFCSRKP